MMRRKAFTLVELLVVIGIIALLVAILLPALNRAREQANQIKCLSNVRQLGMAFQMYADANKGRFPFAAGNLATVVDDEDWIWWQETPVAPTPATWQNNGRPVVDPKQSAIAPYMGGFNPQSFRCPSDDGTNRLSTGPSGGYYRYSYTMNFLMAGYNQNCPRLSAIRGSSDKVLLVEEDKRTINDGYWSPPMVDDTGQQVNVNELTLAVAPVAAPATRDLLEIYHDHSRVLPDVATVAVPMPNADRRGNVAFLDGHAEYATRFFVHNYKHIMPRY
jgi:prepilin-type N-terminal cleavage/methylation domain-containing protein/prepilin-type processing-associated H-X9-DG protein